ncbi:DivIVA domain-containing protein [Micromonospora sp. NPDC049044]|uniref:DivIVA domain-containing protein n=1 Tax=Micromonospora sp. NPDC049044 TaxID=3154827 RepID=UPI003407C92B
MGQLLLLLVVALTVAAVIFGVTVLVSGRDPGLVAAEPDSQAVALPGSRPLRESDVGAVRFDTGLRGYRMAQVDQAMRRAAYDIGYKSELIGVLEAEVTALRAGRIDDADVLRDAREQSARRAVNADAAEPDAAKSEAADTDAVNADAADSDAAESDAADTDAAVVTPAGEPGSGAAPVGSTSAEPLPAATSSSADSDGVAPADPPAGAAAADREQTDGEPADGTGQHGATVRSESA